MSSAAAALAAALDKAIGENEADQGVSGYIDTGYEPLNEIISGKRDGGIPQARIVEVYGPSSSGKTALAQQIMVMAQRAGGVAMFMDHERSLDITMSIELGLDTTPGIWVYKQPETWEESNAKMVQAAKIIRDGKLIPPEAPIVCITDSVASCVPRSVIYDSKGGRRTLDELNMNDTTALARVTSTTLKLVKHQARQYNLTPIYLNQIRTKIGVVYGDPTTTPGGQAMEFFADVRIATSKSRIVDDKDKSNMLGMQIGMKTVKNKVHAPFKTMDLRLMFAPDGRPYFDPIGSLVELLIEQKKLPANGWMEVNGVRGQGRKQLVAALNDRKNPADMKALCDLYYAGSGAASAAAPETAAAALAAL